MMRAVLDSNVVVSAHISLRGVPARALDLWLEGHYTVVVSEPMLDEIERMLAHPRLRRYGVTPAASASFARALREFAHVTPGHFVVTGTARDPKDDMVLAAAVEGSADYIVTGDDDLLSLGSYEGIPIVTPAAFVEIVGVE